jgi:hypothetical protein
MKPKPPAARARRAAHTTRYSLLLATLFDGIIIDRGKRRIFRQHRKALRASMTLNLIQQISWCPTSPGRRRPHTGNQATWPAGGQPPQQMNDAQPGGGGGSTGHRR